MRTPSTAPSDRPVRIAGPRLATILLLAGLAAPQPVAAADFTAELVARSFFRGLLEGRLQNVLPLCAGEVNLDGRRVRDRAELERALQGLADRARQRGLRLRQLVVLDWKEAVRRFGPPPGRLRGSLGPGQLVALARFDRLGVVAGLRREGGFWRVTALTD